MAASPTRVSWLVAVGDAVRIVLPLHGRGLFRREEQFVAHRFGPHHRRHARISVVALQVRLAIRCPGHRPALGCERFCFLFDCLHGGALSVGAGRSHKNDARCHRGREQCKIRFPHGVPSVCPPIIIVFRDRVWKFRQDRPRDPQNWRSRGNLSTSHGTYRSSGPARRRSWLYPSCTLGYRWIIHRSRSRSVQRSQEG